MSNPDESEMHYLNHTMAVDNLSKIGKKSWKVDYKDGGNTAMVTFRNMHVNFETAVKIKEYIRTATEMNTKSEVHGSKKAGYHVELFGANIWMKFSKKTNTKQKFMEYFNDAEVMDVSMEIKNTDECPELIGYTCGLGWMLESGNKLSPPDALYQFCKSVVTKELMDVTKDGIGGLEKQYEELITDIEMPMSNPVASAYFGIDKPSGIILVGPPGNGKSMIIAALAKETQNNVMLLDPNEVASKMHTGTETNIHLLLNEAQLMATDTERPVIVACDEAERLMYARGTTNEWDVLVTNTMLRELSSISSRRNIIFLGATNVPWVIDPAFYREGRIEKMIYIPSPDTKTRKAILDVQTRGMPLNDVDLYSIAKRTENWSGADLKSLCKKAAKLAVKKVAGNIEEFRKLDVNLLHRDGIGITQQSFDEALPEIKADINQQTNWLKDYEAWKGKGTKPPENMFA